jgi:cytochrome c6
MIPKLALCARAFPMAGMLLAALAGAPAHGADIARGASLYATHCASCHGAGGTPIMPGAPDFKRLENLMRPDMQLVAAIRNGKAAMPAYFGILRDREILDVIAYLRTLS